MTHLDAVKLLRPLPITEGGHWADLGAGEGRFSWALADLLGKEGHITAIDKHKRALATLMERAPLMAHVATLSPLLADMTEPLHLTNLDGILLANSLHYVRNQQRLLGQLMFNVRAGGMLVIIDYDPGRRSPWIPFPVGFGQLETLAQKLGLPAPKKKAERRSRYGNGMIYVACITVPDLRR